MASLLTPTSAVAPHLPPEVALRALLVWPGEKPAATLVSLLEDAGVQVDVVHSAEEGIPLARERGHDVVLAPPPTAQDPIWLAPLLSALPALESIALVDPRDPRADAARAAGADELADPRGLLPQDLAHLLLRAGQRARLKRENRRLSEENAAAFGQMGLHARSLELLSTVDIEVLQELILKTLSSLTNAASAALWTLSEREQLGLRGHRGLLLREALPNEIDPRDGPLAARIESGDPFLTEGGPAGAGQALYVPLCANAQPLGLVLLADKLGAGFGPADVAAMRAVSGFAGVALRNAQRFHDLERVGLRDRESPTYNLSYFIDYAGKELYKASRYGRQFSLATLRIDNLEQLRSRLSPGTFAESLRALVMAISRLARDSDVLSRVAENELYLILPETDRFGVLMFERRALETVSALDDAALDGRPAVALTLGSATYPRDGLDFDELLHRCRKRMDETRHTLRRRLHLQDLDFWESIAALLAPWPARVEAQAAGGVDNAAASFRGPLPEEHFARMQREIGRELSRDPRSRGLLYVGTAEAEPRFPLLEFLPPELASRVSLLLRRGQARVDHPAVTTVFLQGVSPMPAAAGQHDFLLYLSEASAYAYVRKRREAIAFHSSDRPLVDHLISRLQLAYDLQPY